MIIFISGFIIGFASFLGLFLFARSAFIEEVIAKAKQKEQQARTQSILAAKKEYVKRNAGGVEVTQEQMRAIQSEGHQELKQLICKANKEKSKNGKVSDETAKKIEDYLLRSERNGVK